MDFGEDGVLEAGGGVVNVMVRGIHGADDG